MPLQDREDQRLRDVEQDGSLFCGLLEGQREGLDFTHWQEALEKWSGRVNNKHIEGGLLENSSSGHLKKGQGEVLGEPKGTREYC